MSERVMAAAILLAILGILGLVGNEDFKEAQWAEEEARQWNAPTMRVGMGVEDF